MFWNKRIKQLEYRVDSLQSENARINWIIENPARFKKGDIVVSKEGVKYQVLNQWVKTKFFGGKPVFTRRYECISLAYIQDIVSLPEKSLEKSDTN